MQLKLFDIKEIEQLYVTVFSSPFISYKIFNTLWNNIFLGISDDGYMQLFHLVPSENYFDKDENGNITRKIYQIINSLKGIL